MSLPHCETLLLEPVEGVLRITLNRPQSRNAMSLAMVGELRAVLAAVRDDRSVRALVLRGADGHFCAGGDIKDMAGARAAGAEAYRTLNRAFGSLLEEAQAAPQLLVALVVDGREALRLGLVHFCEADADALEQRLEETLEQLRRCAPNANAATKALLLASESGELGALLDDAARQFAEAVGGAEGSEGTLAFVQKRKPVWAQ